MKKSILLAALLVINIGAFANEKPDILEDYKLIVGMIDDLYSNVDDIKSRQDNLDNKFGSIRIVKKEPNEGKLTSGVKIEQLSEETRAELLTNLK